MEMSQFSICVSNNGTFGSIFLKQNFNLFTVLNRSIKSMINCNTIKFEGRKLRINVKKYVFLEQSHKGHQMFFGILSIMPCAPQ